MAAGELSRRRSARPWRDGLVAAALVLVPSAMVLRLQWTDGSGMLDVAVAAALVFLLYAWGLSRIALPRAARPDSGRIGRRPLLAGAVVLSWVALVPLGRCVREWSIDVSKSRMEAIAEALGTFHDREGRAPADLDELRRATETPLPTASIGSDASWYVEDGTPIVWFSTPGLIFPIQWTWDSRTRSWAEDTD